MKHTRFESDYAPGTFLHITRLDDGDIVLKISGSGEMRIAMSGGKLHGERLVKCVEGFETAIDALAKDNYVPGNPCDHCMSCWRRRNAGMVRRRADNG